MYLSGIHLSYLGVILCHTHCCRPGLRNAHLRLRAQHTLAGSKVFLPITSDAVQQQSRKGAARKGQPLQSARIMPMRACMRMVRLHCT